MDTDGESRGKHFSKFDNDLVDKVIPQLVKRCEVVFKNDIRLYRGMIETPKPIEYIKPGIKKRGSRDNWNLWNVLFDVSPLNKDHQKRRYSVYFTESYDESERYGDALCVLPVGNPLISYSSKDFVDVIPVNRLQFIIHRLVKTVIKKDALINYILDVFRTSNSEKEILKALLIVSKLLEKEKQKLLDNGSLFSHYEFRKDFVKNILHDLKNKSLDKILFSKLHSSSIKTTNLHNIQFTKFKADEMWTSAPCYIVTPEIYSKCLKYYEKNNT